MSVKTHILVKRILVTGERIRRDGSQDTPFTEGVMVKDILDYLYKKEAKK